MNYKTKLNVKYWDKQFLELHFLKIKFLWATVFLVPSFLNTPASDSGDEKKAVYLTVFPNNSSQR